MESTKVARPIARVRPTVAWVIAHIAIHFWLVALPVLERGAPTFVSYYTASWLMVRGEFTAEAYDNGWYAEQTRLAMRDPGANDIIAPNMPTVGFAALPLLLLEPQTAKAAFTLASWAASWAALLLALRATRPQGRQSALIWLGAGVLLAWSSPFRFNLWAGQYYGFVFLGLTGVWLAMKRRRDAVAGVILGVVFMLKSAGAALFLVPLLYRRLRVLPALITTVVLFIATSLLWISPTTWARYLEVVAASASEPTVAVTAYQTTLGFVAHLLRFDAEWNPFPVADLPWLVRPLYLALTLAAVAATVWMIQRNNASLSLGFALLLILGTVSVPVAEEHHFLVLLLPLLLAAAAWRDSILGPHDAILLGAPWRKPGPLAAFLLIAAAVATLVPMPYEHPRLTAGWWALLAYPRLYGAWLLWAAGLVLTIRRRGSY